jgi:hypothetical protein
VVSLPAFLRLMVLCEPLLVVGVRHCRLVVAFRVVVLRRVFFPLLFFDTLLSCGLLLHIICQFFAFLLDVAVRRVVAVRRHNVVRHLTGFCFVGMQVCHSNMFAGKGVVLLTVFCLFVDFQLTYCRSVFVDWGCICLEIVIVGARRVYCRLCLLLSLICIEYSMVIYSCHTVILVPLRRLDMEEVAVTSLGLMSIEIGDWFRFPLVEVPEHSMLQS